MKNQILILNGYLPFPLDQKKGKASRAVLATVYSNILHYGYAPNLEAYKRLEATPDQDLGEWWKKVEPAFKAATGADKNIGKFIVYKNFPKEVLDFSEADYWIRQILIYLGLPYDAVRQDEKQRENVIEKLPLKSLSIESPRSLGCILSTLFSAGNRWTTQQKAWVYELFFNLNIFGDLSNIPFKENLVDVLASCLNKGTKVNCEISPMDVLRLAAVLSGSTADLKNPFKFKNFSNKQRKFLGSLLDAHAGDKLVENFARNKEKWKRLMEKIHPKDYNFLNVSYAYDKLYNKQAYSQASWTEYYLQNKDVAVFDNISAGDFMRRLKHLYKAFGKKAFIRFSERLGELTTLQLLKIRRQLEFHNFQNSRMFPPKGNWSKVHIVSNTQEIDEKDIQFLLSKIDKCVAERVNNFGSFNYGANLDYIKLQTNDSDLLPYGRGTVFPIPENITFLRSATYWQNNRTCWMDNGWNFFDENWKSVGTCCWNSSVKGKYSVFSGDPVNSGEMKGRAGQLIDVYLDKAKNAGVRYAVWNILSYSNLKFDSLQDIYIALQWGEQPQAKGLFEPSRAVLNAPLRGNALTKFAVLIDFNKRQIVYLDANFKANVRSAAINATLLAGIMPPYLEYLERLPSVGDLTIGLRKSKSKKAIYLGYDDTNVSLNGGKAYIFRPQNENNTFEKFNINQILNAK